MPSPLDALQSALAGTYRVERELRPGGMSRVFLAHDPALDRRVVLKVLSAELAGVVNVERFNRETQLLARLQHPHIVPILTVGTVDGLPWFSMPFIEGESLRARIEREGPLPIGTAVTLLRDIARALAYAHERGVIHRDIKPDNILLTGDSVSVADFGIAKALTTARDPGRDHALTEAGLALGTPGYMSPEQLIGGDAVDHRTDLYALGCVGYEMLCGKAPFAEQSGPQQLRAQIVDTPTPIGERRADVPPALARLVMQCLEKDPAQRPPDANAIVTALEDPLVRSAERTAAPPAATARPRRRVLTAAAVVGAALLTFVGLRAAGVIGTPASLQAGGSLQSHARLVMTDFTVRGADSLLGRVAADAVRAGLAQSDAVSLLTPAEIGAALQRMERPAESRLSPELVRELAIREGAQAIVDGELTVVGPSYVLAVRLVTADSGRELASFRAQASGADSLIHLADDLSRQLRARIGESLRTVKASPPLARVTTGSLEALRRYSAGVQAQDVEGDLLRAATLFREAVTIDTLFAEGWRRLGVVLSTSTAAPFAYDSALTRAYQLRDRLVEIDAERVTASYFSLSAHPDRARAIRAYERVLALGDSTALGALAELYESRREFTRAEALRRLVVARDSALRRLSALRTNLWLQGRWATVDSIEAVVRRRFPADPILEGWDRVRAQMAGDTTLYRRLLERAVAKGDAKDPVQTANRQMMVALAEGRLRDADRFREASIATYRARGVPIEPYIEPEMSLSSAIEAGADSPWRIRAYEEAIRAAPPASRMRASLSAASLYARLGRTVRARAMLAAFDSLATDSTTRAQYAESREGVVGELAFAEGRWADAVALARRNDQLPDGPATSCVHCLPLELMELFAAAGQTDSLLAQHAAYLRTPMGARPLRGPDFTIPIRALWALARAYDARGDRAKAVAAYEAYVARFGRADPELQGKVADARERVRALGVGGR